MRSRTIAFLRQARWIDRSTNAADAHTPLTLTVGLTGDHAVWPGPRAGHAPHACTTEGWAALEYTATTAPRPSSETCPKDGSGRDRAGGPPCSRPGRPPPPPLCMERASVVRPHSPIVYEYDVVVRARQMQASVPPSLRGPGATSRKGYLPSAAAAAPRLGGGDPMGTIVVVLPRAACHAFVLHPSFGYISRANCRMCNNTSSHDPGTWMQSSLVV